MWSPLLANQKTFNVHRPTSNAQFRIHAGLVEPRTSSVERFLQAAPSFRIRIVIHQLIQFLARLHLVDPIRLRAVLSQVAQKFLARFHGNAERAHGVDDHSITVARQLIEAQQRTLAKLGHVRQQRRFNFLRKIAKLLRTLQCSSARASVRAMIRKAGSRRAATAALILPVISSRSTIDFPERWPQRFGNSWSSM